MLPVNEYINHFVTEWEKSSEEFPGFTKAYTRNDKTQREKQYTLFQQKIKALQNRKNGFKLKKDPGQSFFPMFKAFLETVFDFDSDHLDVILSDEFKDVSKTFFYKAREFGPELSPENIYQGLRNVWIMNGLQQIMRIPVKITPSVFAYSMIYPYSDNYLDNPEISSSEKERFSLRFNQRLHGQDIQPENFTEKQLFVLVEMFESEFPRSEFPKVYESLYAIQKGQTDSLQLMHPNGISDALICQICFEKGGASVLADGYLVAGKLNQQQEQALFGYGIYLQLLDDLQDLEEDKNACTKTMFSVTANDSLDKLVNKTIHFGRTVLNEMLCFTGMQNSSLLDLMNRSIETMLIESVGLNEDWYSSKYLQQLEQHSPLHFSFVREKRRQTKSQRFAMFQKYFNSASPAYSAKA